MGPCPLFAFQGRFSAGNGAPELAARQHAKCMARDHERIGRIRETAERVAASYGLEIFDVQLRRESIGNVLRVVIDRPDRGVVETPEDAVGIEDCQRVSHDLSAMLDVEEEELGEAALAQRVHARGVVAGARSAAAARSGLPAVRRAAREDRDDRTDRRPVGLRRPAAGRRRRARGSRGRAPDAPGAAGAHQARAAGSGVLKRLWPQSIRCCSRSTRSPRKRASSRRSSSAPCRTRSRRPRASATRPRRCARGSTRRPGSSSSTPSSGSSTR